VEAYVHEIQATLKEYIDANPPLAGMGTTWTSAHLMPPHAVVVHVGDSRAYLLRDGELDQITHDDTFAQAYIDAGGDPATVRKLRHLLLNTFGGATDEVRSQIYLLEIVPGDQLLVCSDGLTDMVDDQQIAAELRQSATPQAACDRVIAAALASGGKDNVTAIVARAASRS
jgi:protein phosphatase